MTEQEIVNLTSEEARARLNDLFHEECELPSYVEQNAAQFACEYPDIASQPDN